MLNRKICEKCAVENEKNTADCIGFGHRWEIGFVRCRVKLFTGEMGFVIAGINGQPPDGCPYFLEHLINAQ